MINRANWKLIKAYLTYRQEVIQLSEKSLRMDESRLRHVLEWADETSFRDAHIIRPTLPEYLQTARLDGKSEMLSSAYVKKITGSARQFGMWLATHHRGYKRNIVHWLDTLYMSRRLILEDKQHEAVTLDEIRQIAKAPVQSVWEKRIRAAAVFWFLSGIRISAFVSLPLSAVDLTTRTIKQWPSLGVRTKNKKRSTTFLLDIPDLLTVVKEWDAKVRCEVQGNGYWFAPLSSLDGEIEAQVVPIGKNRDARARTDLKRWLDHVGLTYHTPHKFRHGFAVYALKMAQDMADFKAISMNLMHADMSITDGIYSILSEQDISERIATLGTSNPSSQNEIIALLHQIAAQINH